MCWCVSGREVCAGASIGGRCVLVQGGVDLEVAGAGGGSVAVSGALVLREARARGFLQLRSLLARKGGGDLIYHVVELGRGSVWFLVGVRRALAHFFSGCGLFARCYV